jgi:hypothetical protein
MVILPPNHECKHWYNTTGAPGTCIVGNKAALEHFKYAHHHKSTKTKAKKMCYTMALHPITILNWKMTMVMMWDKQP